MTKVKICGLTNLQDALVAVEARADLLGFIFYEPSPRYVAPEKVREIVAGCRLQVAENTHHTSRITHHDITFVGVFVNTPPETVSQILDFCQLDAVQLHGEESPEFVHHFQGRAFKALRPPSPEEAEAAIEKFLPCSTAPLLPCFLLDAYHPHLYGGTGHVTDWGMAASLARRYPLLLAGSLTPDNVREAVQVVHPWGVDVSSGVERAKGKKDHEKVRAFVEAVKAKT